jgi:hypothetical protein
MYDLYPDWGPARHDPDSPMSRALQQAVDLRDDSVALADDN